MWNISVTKKKSSMIIKINRRNNPFAMIDKGILQDKRLSFKARGIASYLFSHEDGWQVRITDIVDASDKDGIDAVRSGMKELAALNYAALKTVRGEDGKVSGKHWEVYETSTDIGKIPTSGKTDGGKTPTTNNKDTSIYSPIVKILNEQTGSKYRASSKKTQSLINARVREGATIEDFEKVITHMTAKWHNDSKMAQYLRPETLFGTKFEGYLNDAIRAGQKAEAQKDVELSPELEAKYNEYIAHITKTHPGVTATAAYLSKAEYKLFKERKYLNGLGYLGEPMERRALQLAHNHYEQNHPDAVKYRSVWEYHCAQLAQVIKESTTI